MFQCSVKSLHATTGSFDISHSRNLFVNELFLKVARLGHLAALMGRHSLMPIYLERPYVMLIPHEHPLLQGSNVVTQQNEPLTLHANLTHVNVAGRDVFVSAV